MDVSKSPAVSVVLPAFNAAQTLRLAVDSLAAQTFPDFELVVVNDGSTDGTGELLCALAAADARVRPVFQLHTGIVGALNAGISAARGSLIARMDADDVCHPERLARQVAHLMENPVVGLVGCRVAFGGDAETSAGYLRHVDFVNAQCSAEDIMLSRFRESPFAHPSVMFRRALIEHFGGYRDGPFPEDYELWLRWLEAGVRMEKVPQTLLTWNDPPGRLSRIHPNYSVERFYEMKFGYLARWLARHNPFHPEIHVVGAGRITRRRVDALRAHGVVVKAYADIDPRKVGRTLDGVPVIHHEQLPAAGCGFVVTCVGRVGAAESLRALFEARGLRRGADFIEAA